MRCPMSTKVTWSARSGLRVNDTVSDGIRVSSHVPRWACHPEICSASKSVSGLTVPGPPRFRP